MCNDIRCNLCIFKKYDTFFSAFILYVIYNLAFIFIYIVFFKCLYTRNNLPFTKC